MATFSTTPLVAKGDFCFTNGVFFAETPGHHRHRRATHEELRTHFASGSASEYSAHWFEAQLMHYSLPRSKKKSVARMRLFDTIQQGSLSVPPHIAELEQKLRKIWTKWDSDEKEHEAAKTSGSRAEAATAVKRKPEDASSIAGSTDAVAAEASASKRSRTSASSADGLAPARRFATKQTARRGSSRRAPSRPGLEERAFPSPEPVPSHAPRTRCMARRARPSGPRGRIPSAAQTSGQSDFATSSGGSSPRYEEEHSVSTSRDGRDDLGPISGRYDLSYLCVEDTWLTYGTTTPGSNSSLVLTTAGSKIWGRFDFGVIQGVLYIEERPRVASIAEIPFCWRGRDAEGEIVHDESSQRGEMRFLGDDRVAGLFLYYQEIQFEGRRSPGQGTRSELDVTTLQNEWDSYNADENDYENQVGPVCRTELWIPCTL